MTCLCIFVTFLGWRRRDDCTCVLRIYQTDLHQIFTAGRHVAVDVQSGICFAIAEGTLPWQPVLGAEWAKGKIRHIRHISAMVWRSPRNLAWWRSLALLTVSTVKNSKTRVTGLLILCLHDAAGCTTGMTTGWMFVYTIQPVVQLVVKPVWQPVWQQVVSCKRGAVMVDKAWRATAGLCHAFLVLIAINSLTR